MCAASAPFVICHELSLIQGLWSTLQAHYGLPYCLPSIYCLQWNDTIIITMESQDLLERRLLPIPCAAPPPRSRLYSRCSEPSVGGTGSGREWIEVLAGAAQRLESRTCSGSRPGLSIPTRVRRRPHRQHHSDSTRQKQTRTQAIPRQSMGDRSVPRTRMNGVNLKRSEARVGRPQMARAPTGD